VLGIKQSELRKVEIPLPPLSTQKNIASILSTYDNLIENNTRRIQILEEMAQRIYKEWFVDFKYPGYEDDQMIDSELGKIPDGWDVKEFGEKITFTRGKNITKKEMVHGEVPVVSAGINPSGFHNVSSVNGPVVTISASGANAGYISYYLRNIWAADCSYINNEMTPYIFYYFSLVKFNSKEITNLQRGAAQPHVYPKDVARISIIDPRVETIEIFENIVENIFNEIGVLRKKISNLRQTRDLLLPKLISGKVDVSDLDIDTSILYD
jgi:type I restriction enzyme S subunit